MNTQSGIIGSASGKIDSVEYALGGFCRYMNRPIAKVHVFTWRLACRLESGLSFQSPPPGGIRYLPAYRSADVRLWRKAVADYLRMVRQNRRNEYRTRMTLPVYDEASAQYQFQQS